MKGSRAPQTSPENDIGTPARKTAAGSPGKLSRTEAFLYDSARCIDRVFDLIIDRPGFALALAAGVAVLVAVIPHR